MTQEHLERQVLHWSAAIDRLYGWESWASAGAWQSLEQTIGLALRDNFTRALESVRQKAAIVRMLLKGAQTDQQLDRVRRELLVLRREFVRVETMLDFFGDAVNTRTNREMACLLRACDLLAERSMRQLLEPLGQPTPPALTYLDKGLGASILKAGLRLWDGRTINSVATIKIVRHNLMRPTSLIHEAGHQVAHQLGWNEQLASALETNLKEVSPTVAAVWSGWASEIAADIFAFVHTGYASVAALHDVLAGEEDMVFAVREGDPHPTAYVRVLLGVEMCRRCYGNGVWDDLAEMWKQSHPLDRAPKDSRELLRKSTAALPKIAEVCLDQPLPGFRGKSIRQWIDPMRVSPENLGALAKEAGESLYRTSYWVHRECLRITALTGYRSAVAPAECQEMWRKQKEMMLLMGGQYAEISKVA